MIRGVIMRKLLEEWVARTKNYVIAVFTQATSSVPWPSFPEWLLLSY